MAKKKTKASAKAHTIANDIRDAISITGKSANELSKATGVPQPTITRFIAGADMRLSTASKLADHFGMRLQPRFIRIEVEQIKDATKAFRANVVTGKDGVLHLTRATTKGRGVTRG